MKFNEYYYPGDHDWSKMMEKPLDEIRKRIKNAQAHFEMNIEAAALEVTNIAKQISPAIGDISIIEAEDAIIQEFIKRVKNHE